MYCMIIQLALRHFTLAMRINAFKVLVRSTGGAVTDALAGVREFLSNNETCAVQAVDE